MPALLTSAYLAPVQYYTKFLLHRDILIEIHESYIKQSYRNRCSILAANGLLTLSIPVKKIHGNNTKTKDIIIDYDTNWQKLHFKSIESAYRSSPFYEFYIDDFLPFFTTKTEKLLEFNAQIQEKILKALDFHNQTEYTTNFISQVPDHITDYREIIQPKSKVKDKTFIPKTYQQVFSEKHGFMPNLSILDLLFNEGPNSMNYLRDCIQMEGRP